MKKKSLYNIAIVGATGLVGRTFLQVLEEKKLPIGEIRLLASQKSAGKVLPFLGCDCVVEECTPSSFANIDFALFSAGAEVSKKYAPYAVASGATVIDNSSAWRMDDNVPLVVPEVNFEDIKNSKLIANPNCSTIQSVIPLKALDDAFGIDNVLYTTYQAVSGSGQNGLDDLRRTLAGEPNRFYPYDISKTCIPEIDVFLENGYTKEEMKMVQETKKILHRPDLKVAATCVRVPVEIGHGVSVSVLLKRDALVSEIQEVFQRTSGLILVDEPEKHIYPTSTQARGSDLVYVGRIRKDLRFDYGILFYVSADNVRKGAAANAVQILERIIKEAGENND